MNTTDFIKIDYEKHPAYEFNAKPYEVDLQKIAAFDRGYRQLTSGEKVGGSEFKSRCGLLATQRREIFDEMRSHAADEFERLFLEELETATTVLLDEDLDFYQGNGIPVSTQVPESEKLKALKSSRCFWGQLSDETTSKILATGAEAIGVLRSRAAQKKHTREDLSFNAGKVVATIAALLNREFAAAGILDAVSQYMGRKYKVGGLALEISVPGATWWRNTLEGIEQPKTMYAHLDESIRHPKSIVYLSNVTAQNGPTSCNPGVYERLDLNALQDLIGRIINKVGIAENSPLKDYYGRAYHQTMSSERFRRHFMKLPPQLRFNSHFGWDVIAGSDAEKSIADKEKTMLGGPGTFIVFDGGRLLHRGGLLMEGERIVLQVIFIPVPTVIQNILSLPGRVIAKLMRMLK